MWILKVISVATKLAIAKLIKLDLEFISNSPNKIFLILTMKIGLVGRERIIKV